MRTSTPAIRPAASPLPDIVGLGGTIAGLVGGLAMAIVGAIISLTIGGDIWLESKQIAAAVYGPAALASSGFDAGPVLIGTLLHFVVSAAFGALFGIVMRRVLHLTSDFGTMVLAGLIYGMLLWLLAFFVILPLLNPTLLETYAPSFIIQHIVYGVVTGLAYTWLRPLPYNEFA
jgi:hypothetical protein